jgi:endonuclease/exonuclease/phosphatase family metal-dependent hydrolase
MTPGKSLLVALLPAASLVGCASAVNYLDPAAPLYVVASDDVAAPRPASSLRVVTFNIAYGIEIERAVAVLREKGPLRDPDVLALQEMDAPGTARVARALGMNAVYFPSGIHPKHRRDFGCALLSPWPLEGPRKVVLPHGSRGSGLRRSATSAVLVRGEQRIRVYSVHLPSPLAVSGSSRRDELRALAADAAAAPEPVVIAGDFNSHGKVDELAKAGFAWVTREVGATTHVELFGRELMNPSFDHVLTRGFRAEGFGVVERNRGASDHLPVWAVLELDDARH